MAASIPAIDELSPEYVSSKLRAAGVCDATVAGLHLEPVGTGQVAGCARVNIEYAHVGGDAPTTIIAKYPSPSELSRSNAVAMGIYRREVEFYRDVAPRLTMALPRIYVAEIDDAGERFLILMEDLAPAEQGDQLAGCSPEVVRAAVMELVGLQAPTWCDAELGARFMEPEDGFFADMHGLYNQALPEFIERFGPRLDSDELAIICKVGACASAPLFQPVGEPFCLEHRDYRLDNLMIDPRLSPPRVVVVDWQGMRTGRPLNDVALCLAGSLEPATRREVEEDVLCDYHRGLVEAGVQNFSWNECWQEYRRASFAGFGLAVVSAPAVVQTPRGDDMFTAMARRYARHALDLDAAAFLR